jgi:hypothetical protein
MPLVGAFEAGEAASLTEFFSCQESFEGFGQSVREALDTGGGNRIAAFTFELGGEVILGEELFCFVVVGFDGFEHLVVEMAR